MSSVCCSLSGSCRNFDSMALLFQQQFPSSSPPSLSRGFSFPVFPHSPSTSHYPSSFPLCHRPVTHSLTHTHTSSMHHSDALLATSLVHFPDLAKWCLQQLHCLPPSAAASFSSPVALVFLAPSPLAPYLATFPLQHPVTPTPTPTHPPCTAAMALGYVSHAVPFPLEPVQVAKAASIPEELYNI